MTGVRFPRILFCSPPRLDGLWSPPSLLPTGTGDSHLLLFPRLKNEWSYTASPPHVFIALCLFKHRDFTLSTYVTNYRRGWGSSRLVFARHPVRISVGSEYRPSGLRFIVFFLSISKTDATSIGSITFAIDMASLT
jgi:hypothetical protein